MSKRHGKNILISTRVVVWKKPLWKKLQIFEKYGTTRKNTQRHYTTKRLIRYMYSRVVWAVYKTGTGTVGRVCGDVETWGRVGRDAGMWERGDSWDAGTSNIEDAGGKVGGKCDISFFVKMCYLWLTLTAFDSKQIKKETRLLVV